LEYLPAPCRQSQRGYPQLRILRLLRRLDLDDAGLRCQCLKLQEHYGIDDAQRLSRRQSYKKKVIRASRMVEDMPTLFRILYCCGLRPGEVLHLEVGDVDLKKGVLLVRASKNDNDR
jgi:integrase